MKDLYCKAERGENNETKMKLNTLLIITLKRYLEIILKQLLYTYFFKKKNY